MSRALATFALASITTLSALVSGACSSEGATAVCPDLPLYNPHELDAAFDPKNRAAELAAVDAGCATQRGDAQSVKVGDGAKGD